MQLDSAADDVERRPRVPAGGAAIVAEVSDVRRRVLVRRSAAQAVLRIGGVLKRRPGEPRIVEPEDGGTCMSSGEIGDLRVVAVHHERRILRQPGDGAAPALRDELELPVAVELVAEEVCEQDRPGPDPAHHLGERALVDLEQAQLRVSRGEEGRGDAGDEVRARAVVREPEARAQDLGRHRRGGRLPVRRRHDRGAGGQPGGEAVDRSGVELREQLAGHGRAAAGARQPRESRDGARRDDLRGEGDGGAHGTERTPREGGGAGARVCLD